jgi:hypothetical protein
MIGLLEDCGFVKLFLQICRLAANRFSRFLNFSGQRPRLRADCAGYNGFNASFYCVGATVHEGWQNARERFGKMAPMRLAVVNQRWAARVRLANRGLWYAARRRSASAQKKPAALPSWMRPALSLPCASVQTKTPRGKGKP